jgi:hypothetical protein
MEIIEKSQLGCQKLINIFQSVNLATLLEAGNLNSEELMNDHLLTQQFGR